MIELTLVFSPRPPRATDGQTLPRIYSENKITISRLGNVCILPATLPTDPFGFRRGEPHSPCAQNLQTLLIACTVLVHPISLFAEAVAVSSTVFNNYTRQRLPDGPFKPELYVFGEGGCWTRPIDDPKMQKLTFPQIGRIVAGPLAKMNYRPAFKASDVGLLILVFWGSTEGSRDRGGNHESINRARREDPAGLS